MIDYVVLQDSNGPDAIVIPTSYPGPKGDPGSAGEGHTSRAALATAGNAATDFDDAYLSERGREGKFVFDAADQSANVTWDTEQAVYVPKAGTPSGSAGAWIRIGDLHPKHFGIIPGDGTDHGAKLNKFFEAIPQEQGKRRFSMEGEYQTAEPLILDPGAYGTVPKFTLDLGGCSITALAAMDHLLTAKDIFLGRFTGKAHLYGTNAGSDDPVARTAQVALRLQQAGGSAFDFIDAEGFGYALIETSHSNNDSISIGRVNGKRLGSGSPTGALVANWELVDHVGDSGSEDQYSELSVDVLPPAYVQAATDSADHRQCLVQFGTGAAAKARLVKYMGDGVIRVFPWLTDAIGTSGTLRYHYGGGMVWRGSDSQLFNIGSLDILKSGTVIESGALYGQKIGMMHGEDCGSFARLGPDTDSASPVGQSVDFGYAEASVFRFVALAKAIAANRFGVMIGDDGFDKDVDLSSPAASTATESSAFAGFTRVEIGGQYGLHRKLKAGPNNGNREYLNFANPNIFSAAPKFLMRGSNPLEIRLVAPAQRMVDMWGQDFTEILIGGEGPLMEPAGGAITFVSDNDPGSDDTINGATGTFTLPPLQMMGKVGVAYLGKSGDVQQWMVGKIGQSPVLDTVELIPNGDFEADITGVTGSGLSWDAADGGSLRMHSGGGTPYFDVSASVTAGQLYRILLDVGQDDGHPRMEARSTGYSGTIDYFDSGARNTGEFSRVIKATGPTLYLHTYASTVGVDIDSLIKRISVRKVV